VSGWRSGIEWLEAKNMKSDAKVNRTKKAAKNSSPGSKSIDQSKRNVEDTVANAQLTRKSIPTQNSILNTESSYYDIDSAENEGSRNDLWMLKYDINEKGIGRILLPPSLSTLLQSDRVSISPSAGGLFIRSV
jgi:hypothetical protein